LLHLWYAGDTLVSEVHRHSNQQKPLEGCWG